MPATPQVPRPPEIIFQYGLSSVLTGLDPSNAQVGFRHVLLVVATTGLGDTDKSTLRQIVPDLVANQALKLRTALDSQPALANSDLSAKEALSKTAEEVATLTNKQFILAVRGFDTGVRARSPKSADEVALGIGVRYCDGINCKLDAFAVDPHNKSFARYSSLHEWMKAKGLTSIGTPYVLDKAFLHQGQPDSAAKYDNIEASFEKNFAWQSVPLAQDRRNAFVSAASRARHTHVPINYVSAELAGLSREPAAHLADVFDSALAAGSRLSSDPSITLHGISDENARARLIECVRLRGNFDPTNAGECAGLNISPVELSQCMAGQTCAPAFGNLVNPGALSFSVSRTFPTSVTSGDLPRIGLGSIDDMRKEAANCGAANQDDGEAAYCLVKSRLAKSASAQLSCIEAAGTQGRTALGGCAASLLPASVRTQADCLQEYRSDGKAMALCAGLASLPPSDQKLVTCAVNAGKGTSFDALACIGAANGSREAACIVANRDSWEKSALCIAGETLPSPVKAGLACAEKTTSPAGFGVCVVVSQGTGDAQRLASCYVEGQGDPTAVAVCMASQNLTADQRIALECAAETKGALPAFAVCTGGRLATKELINCRGQRFAEGNCFGETNELRKIVKQMGTDIGPNSVVAQIADVQLQVMEFETKPIIDAIGKVAPVYAAAAPYMVDPSHITPADALGPVGPAVVEYCKHNQCQQIVAAAAGGALGGVLGGAIGGVLGGPIGGALGGLTGGGAASGRAKGAAIGGAVGGPVGAAIGGALGGGIKL